MLSWETMIILRQPARENTLEHPYLVTLKGNTITISEGPASR